MKTILLTGIGGFIGSHALQYILEKTDWQIIGLDSFRHKGTYSRLNEVTNFDKNRVTIFNHDLTVPIDTQLENRIMKRTLNGSQKVDYILNFASDSAVERSVSDPGACWRNNCELIFNMLELARRIEPEIYFQVSTDEVYGDCAVGYSHKEWDVILPSNPYSSSKAAQESLCISYYRTYNVPILILNIMNCIGEWQDREKFLPKLIWKIATDQTMEIYADNGLIGSRYYLYAKNVADAIIYLSKFPVATYKGGSERPDRYNVCGNAELNNLEMAQLVAKLMGKELKYELVASKSARPGYDRRYALDGSKLREHGWEAPISFEASLERIVEWTLKNPHWIL